MLIIDCNNICHIAKHTVGKLSHGGRKTGVMFGFLKSLKDFIKHFDDPDVVFTWDSTESIRKQMYAGYKEKREKIEKTEEEKNFDEDSFKQFVQLRKEIIPKIGWKNNFHETGFEADDIIAKVVLENKLKHGKVIVSSDNDLYQLLDYCFVYHPMTKELMSQRKFRSMYGIDPVQWVDVKFIGGCTTDEVPGIDGIGEKSAIKYLWRTDGLKGSKKEKIDMNYKFAKNAFEPLVKLPLIGLTKKKYVLQKNQFDFGQFVDICEENSFQYFLKPEQIKEWKEVVFRNK